MPESVHLNFVPPARAGFTKLRIYEAPNAVDALVLIETINGVGAYPDYISEYTTNLATSKTDWFAIEWEDDKGAKTPITARIKGGTDTLVGKVVERVMQRDRSLDEDIVRQEAEGAIEYVFGIEVDPYDIDASTVGYGQLNGLVYLTMARSFIFEIARATEAESVTLGLVSLKSSSAAVKDIDKLITLANGLLGISTSRVLQIESMETSLWVNVLEP